MSQKIEDLLPLKPNWLHILMALSAGDQHGYGIMQDVLDRTWGTVRLWPATRYGSIKRVMEADLIEELPRRPAPELDDARRRYYRLTPLGRRRRISHRVFTAASPSPSRTCWRAGRRLTDSASWSG